MSSGTNSQSEEIQAKTVFTTDTEAVSEDGIEHAGKSEINAALKADTWTPEEERLLLRRLDFYLIPLVMVMFFTLNLDR
jgi:hypothetical protein